MTTLVSGATTITLPTDLLWVDELAWQPIEYVSRYSVGGALLLNFGTRLTGRAITLQGGENWAWVTRAVALQLKALADLPSPDMTLTYRGTAYAVTWAPEGAPLAATAVRDVADPVAGDYYYCTLRFITRT